MRSSASRRFRIGDAMALTASLGLGLSMVRLELRLQDEPVYAAFKTINRLLVAIALGLIVIRLLPPRPPRRRLLREPGFIACIGCWIGVLCHLLDASYSIYTEFEGTTLLWSLGYACDEPGIRAGILAPWLFLGLSGHFRRPKDWVDWSGSVVGILLVMGLVSFRALPFLTGE
jgi:drug/metabolite transporter (DMT)-like permease